MRVERVVLDTNVLISAALSPLGKPFACLRWVLDNATLIVSSGDCCVWSRRLPRDGRPGSVGSRPIPGHSNSDAGGVHLDRFAER